MGIVDVLIKQKTERVGIKLALLDLPLDLYAQKRMALSVWSRTADDAVWLVSGAKEGRYLSRQGISPRLIYTSAQIVSLLALPGMEQPISPKVHDAIMLLDATIMKIWEW